MDQPNVFVVIPNWNLKEDTIACVESVLAGEFSPARIAVVDNGSHDDSAQALAGRFGNEIDLLVNERNLGFAGGANVGIRRALVESADYVLLLNNDTVLDKEMLAQLVKLAESDFASCILGPAIYYHDDPERFWRLGSVNKRWSPIPLEIGRDAMDKGQYKEPFAVDYVPGCAMWVPAEIFQTIGLLDEDFFMYYEDADFCRRAQASGYRIAVAPQARVWHKVARSTRQHTAWGAYHRTRNRIIFYNRHTRGVKCMLANLYLIASTLVQMLRAVANRPLVVGFWNGFRDGWRSRRKGQDGSSPAHALAPGFLGE